MGNGEWGIGSGGTRGASALRGFPDLKHLAWTRGASALGGFADLKHLAWTRETISFYYPFPITHSQFPIPQSY
ncbi:hypothetical protein PI95_019325 [Hassallia byssoidea VB512170]|uniref:Uncharacterized protein n=1 Tax=Hassallia byssoidea VB512170 TaxID=1304833 RepID=A0A846HBC0_9CYAN|nr:hypothetical protein [Hassalia byssoidea]NEU74646.1 hypothetical protein [Hassalia byssoidea VB512170]